MKKTYTPNQGMYRNMVKNDRKIIVFPARCVDVVTGHGSQDPKNLWNFSDWVSGLFLVKLFCSLFMKAKVFMKA